MIEPRWVSLRSVLAIHEAQLSRFGGASGIRDQGLLESALARPQQIFAYEEHVSLARLATAYAYGIVRNHPFVDGNKRAAFLTAGLFLLRNGWLIEAPETEVVTSMLLLASNDWSEAQFTAWVDAHLVEA